MAKKNPTTTLEAQYLQILENTRPDDPLHEKTLKDYLAIRENDLSFQEEANRNALDKSKQNLEQDKLDLDRDKLTQITEKSEEDLKLEYRKLELEKDKLQQDNYHRMMDRKIHLTTAILSGVGSIASLFGGIFGGWYAAKKNKETLAAVLKYEETGTIASFGGKNFLSGLIKPNKK